MHNPQDDGWGRVDCEMFPIIGPTIDKGYQIETPKGVAYLDQHGLAREIPYELGDTHDDNVCYLKSYLANTNISNPKYTSGNSTLEHMIWPYDFSIRKKIFLRNDCLYVDFLIRTEKDMPYMFGYHPAFKTSKNDYITQIQMNDEVQKSSILDINQKEGNCASFNCEQIYLHRIGCKHDLVVESIFETPKFMCWAPNISMMCIEPVTHIQGVDSDNKMLESSGEETEFSICLIPRRKADVISLRKQV